MGQNERQEEAKRDNKRAKAREKSSRRRGSEGAADWREFEWLHIAALTQAVGEADGAVRIGRTRDRGAWAIGIYLGDDYGTEYIKPSEVFTDAVEEIAREWCPDGGELYTALIANALAASKR